MTRHVALLLLAGLCLSACGLTSTPAAPELVPVNDLSPALAAMWDRLDQGGPVLWQPAYTPLFPATWPPGPTTIWVRYAYAYGQDMALSDGARVAGPWARVEFQADRSKAAIIPLQTRLESFGVQGVRPLDSASQARLKGADQVQAYCLQLTALPDPAAPEAGQMRTFYQAWLNNNGTIAGAIKDKHAPFFEWLAAR